MRAFVKQLRQKLGDDAANPAWIFNVRGVGYRMPRPGAPGELTATEYELLRALALNAGRVTTSETLLDRVWAGRGNGDTKVVRAFVKQLRQKLGDDAANPAWIFNVRGVGYRMPRPGAPGEP